MSKGGPVKQVDKLFPTLRALIDIMPSNTDLPTLSSAILKKMEQDFLDAKLKIIDYTTKRAPSLNHLFNMNEDVYLGTHVHAPGPKFDWHNEKSLFSGFKC